MILMARALIMLGGSLRLGHRLNKGFPIRLLPNKSGTALGLFT